MIGGQIGAYGRGWHDPGRYVWSPFVIKLEARLRFANIPYKTASGSVKTAPKGKVPYTEITDPSNENPSSTGSDTTSIGDSSLIIKHLVERNILPDLNGDVYPPQRAHDLALRALLEDKAYFYNKTTTPCAIPYAVRIVVGLLIYRSTVQTLQGQGTGRYSAEEIRGFRVEAWEAVNDLLVALKAKTQSGDAPFWVLGGEEPTEADTTVFGFVVSALICDAGPKTRELVNEFPVITEYARRIHDAYFPDYERWLSRLTDWL
ncbi:hypothetical protein BDW62DRAFT_201394 [Aspergillus aurantiobrunneus]